MFGRRVSRRTPGRFHTQIVTRGVEPTLRLHDKHSSIANYFKAERGLRTERTINDACDFDLGRKLANLDALREIGFATNRRLLELQRLAHDCALPAPGLRFADPRVMALLRSLCHLRRLTGFTNRSLRELVAAELGRPYSARQMTYDLRRLRRKGLIERIPRSHRYRLTALGRRVVFLFSKLHVRIVRPALRDLDPSLPLPAQPHSLAHGFDQALDRLVAKANLTP